ncbi:MAG: PEP/pyruvate-binding domain-containing protein, partial [Anaerolineae bacterium]
MRDLVLSFRELSPREWASAGGKGSTLARLCQAGYPVPEGVVILPGAFCGDELHPDSLSADTLSAEAWTQVQAHLAQLRRNDPQAAFAVRSSALAEDSARASFAGEFVTVLDVRSDETVQQAIEDVRHSRHSDRVLAYARARGVETDLEMAVVVQRL